MAECKLILLDENRNNNFCRQDQSETKIKSHEAADVPVPDYDPIVSQRPIIKRNALLIIFLVWTEW